jgi:hypothetical protein
MESIDLNINNYSFDDILKLFKLTPKYDNSDLIETQKIVLKIHPDISHLDNKYYDLFLSAYNILKQKLEEQQKRDEIDKRELEYDVREKNIYRQHYLIDIEDEKKSCYKPYDYIHQIVTIHTEDRDILKYPLANNFEVELPQVFKNVLTLELFDITLPTYYYNISEVLQNTGLWFSIPQYFQDPIELRMLSGNYTSNTFVEELKKKLNDATTKKLYEIKVYASPNTKYTYFDVVLNNISNKLEIYNKENEFIFWCQKKVDYIDCLNDNWKMLNDWGLPYNIGFYKECYTSMYDNTLNKFVLIPPNIFNIAIDNTIYMEIDKFNYINELNPFSISTNSYYNNDYNGIVNSAFSKLILSNVTNTYVPVHKFKRILPHIEQKIAKFKFRFRYHNGNLVDFAHQNFNFSIKLECRFNCQYTT